MHINRHTDIWTENQNDRQRRTKTHGQETNCSDEREYKLKPYGHRKYQERNRELASSGKNQSLSSNQFVNSPAGDLDAKKKRDTLIEDCSVKDKLKDW